MTNAKDIDEIICEMDRCESPSTSEASFDLAPTIQKEIKQLAESLRETNQNLHTYEFMLGRYKKLAKVSPIPTQNNQHLEMMKIDMHFTKHYDYFTTKKIQNVLL